MNTIICKVYKIDFIGLQSNDDDKKALDGDKWVCEEDHTDTGGDLTTYFIENVEIFDSQIINDLAYGSSYIEVPTKYLSKSTLGFSEIYNLNIQSVDEIKIISQEKDKNTSRRLSRFNGNRDVLIIRIDANDSQTTRNNKQLSDDFFGTFGKNVSPKSQMDHCSKNKLRFVPASGNGIQNGVLTVKLNQNVKNLVHIDVKNKASEKARKMLGKSLKSFSHVAFCLPPGTVSSNSKNWVAFGYYTNFQSVYNNLWCSSLSATLHEMGHNLGLHHSGETHSLRAEREYGDQSGIMGFSYLNRYSPQMCFNAAKSWWMGFYNDRTFTIKNPTMEPQRLKLAGIVDYYKGISNDYSVILRLEPSVSSLANQNRFLMYNRAKGFNKGTIEFRNAVTVVRQKPTELAKSNVDGYLQNDGDRHVIHNWDNTNKKLIVKLCGTTRGSVDYADVLVYLSDDSNSDIPCNVETDYFGCFNDKPRQFNERIAGQNHNKESCEKACGNRNYLMYGLQYFGECRCGNYMMNQQMLPEGHCNTKCRSNQGQKCGGPYKNSVYKVTKYDECDGDLTLNSPKPDGQSYNEETCKTACASRSYSFYELKYMGKCSCWSQIPSKCLSRASKQIIQEPDTSDEPIQVRAFYSFSVKAISSKLIQIMKILLL